MSRYQPRTDLVPLHDANRLGLAYRHEAGMLPWRGPIVDVHLHLNDLAAARTYFDVAQWFGIERVWAMTPMREFDAINAAFGDRIEFIAVPDYARRNEPETFTTQWLRDIEAFAEKGVRICKFWAAPRGRDLHPALRLDSPVRQQAMALARDLGMVFMTHVSDPDTWFATHYADHHRYGTKAEQYEPLERCLEQFHDVPWVAAHMAGDPERLDHLQDLLDRFPNLYLDTSATKWMVRELSKHPWDLASFVRRNPGRIMFGSDIVASPEGPDPDWYASRYWALRTLWETNYEGNSPIADPDLSMLDPTVPATAAPVLRGCQLDSASLAMLYHGAEAAFWARLTR